MNTTLQIRDGIELRVLQITDAEELFRVIEANKEHLREWLGWVDDDKTIADTEKYIKGSIERFNSKEGIDWQIWCGNHIIGGVGLSPIDHAHKKVSIGYWLAKEFEGKGIMTDSVKVVIDYIFGELKLNRIAISCAVQNKKSSRIPKKLGFTFEGVSREGNWLYDHFVDLEVYSLLASEWVSK